MNILQTLTLHVIGGLIGLLEVYMIPVVNRWQHPCYSHRPTTALILAQRHRSLKDVLENLTRKSDYFAASSQRLRDKYFVKGEQRRITDGFLIQRYETDTVPNTEIDEDQVIDNVTEVFLEQYRKLSTLAVFFDEMIKDEINYEGNEIGDEMQRSKNDLYGIMCDIHTSINTTLNSSIPEYVTRNVTDDWQHSENNTRFGRYVKGFIISNNALKIANQLSKTYHQLYSNLTLAEV